MYILQEHLTINCKQIEAPHFGGKYTLTPPPPQLVLDKLTENQIATLNHIGFKVCSIMHKTSECSSFKNYVQSLRAH